MTTTTTALKEALDVASRAVSASKAFPALMCVLLDATPDNGLTVSGTDISVRAWRTIAARVDEPGQVALPASALASFAGALTGDEVRIEVNGKHKAILTAGRAELKLSGLDPEAFPPAPDFDAPQVDLTLGADLLAEAIGCVVHAVAAPKSANSTREVLMGMLIQVRDGRLTLAAADGFRLAVLTIELADGAPDFSVIAGRRGVVEVQRLLGRSTSARLAVDGQGSRLLVDTEAGCWSIGLIEGQFPDWRRVIPRDAPLVLTVQREAFLSAIRLCQPVAVQNSGILRLTITEGSLLAGAAADDETAETTIDADLVRGKPHPYALNCAYLRDAVEALGGEVVTLEVGGPGLPCLIHDGRPEMSAQVCMPMSTSR